MAKLLAYVGQPTAKRTLFGRRWIYDVTPAVYLDGTPLKEYMPYRFRFRREPDTEQLAKEIKWKFRYEMGGGLRVSEDVFIPWREIDIEVVNERE